MTERGEFPPDADRLMAAMATYHEELARPARCSMPRACSRPAKAGACAGRQGGKRVVDGPFAESKELVAGYTLIQVRNRDEAMEWARRFPNPIGEARAARSRCGSSTNSRTSTASDGSTASATSTPATRPTPEDRHHARKIFVNLPIKDMQRSQRVLRALGFTFNPQFTNEQGACMVISENIYVMLLVEPFFQTFTSKSIADARRASRC